MNLAFKYPLVFWNCACLIVNSGGDEVEEFAEQEESISCIEEQYDSCIDFDDNDEDDDDEDDDDDGAPVAVKKKKKNKKIDYDKIASAIGKMKSEGTNIIPPNINKSSYTFTPDVENNAIIYGLSGITKVGEDLVQNIMKNRPYKDVEDLTSKVKINKTQVVNLIKAGAFDWAGDRQELMKSYIESISDKKKDLNLRNMQMLISYNMIPEDMDFYRRLFNFNKYLKNFKSDDYYLIDENSLRFLNENYDVDDLIPCNENGIEFKIEQSKWDKIYKKEMEPMRAFLKKHKEEMLNKLNDRLYKEMWDKYCLGNISKWEMDSISFYYHDHELARVRNQNYDFSDFFKLPEEPEIENMICINGRDIPIYKLHRICGTVLGKDKAKNTVTILTTTGVVRVKIWNNQFVKYDKQISRVGADGKKKVIEKSWFSRGNKIAFVGIRRDDVFIPKIYKSSPWTEPINLVVQITDADELIFQKERREEE